MPDRLPPGVSRVTTIREEFPTLYGPDGKPLPAAVKPKDGERPWPVMPAPPATNPSDRPRTWVPPVGYNMTRTPRAQQTPALTAFDQLRALGDFDLVRIAIEDVKGQVLGASWDVVPRDEFKNEDPEDLEERIAKVREWVEEPDPLAGYDFEDWLSTALEEILVTDALSLYPSKRRNGDPIGLELLDGATIKPLVDNLGRPPIPPDSAYQQIVNSQPETEFELGELWYLPRHRRPNGPYGRSPTEAVLTTINVAVRASLHDLAYFTDGTIPESLYQVPAGWSPERVDEFQRWFDDELAGNAAKRSGGLRFVPGGDGAGYLATKDHQWQYERQEWMARVIAWAFGVSPMPIAKVMNRATAQALEQSTAESGVRPVLGFLARIINRYIRQELRETTVEFRWGADETEDATVAYQRDIAYMNAGRLGIDESRANDGLEPLGVRPFINHPTLGPMFVDDLAVQSRAAEERRRTAFGEPVDDDVTDDDEPVTADEKADLRRWAKCARRDARAEREPREFKSTAICQALQDEITTGLEKAGRDLGAIHTIFETARAHLHGKATCRRPGTGRQPPALKAGDPRLGPPGHPAPTGQVKAERALERTLRAYLKRALEEVLRFSEKEIAPMLRRRRTGGQEKLRKQGGEFDLTAGQELRLQQILTRGLPDLVEAIEGGILDAASAGAADASAAMGVAFSRDALPESVLDFARRRAAEMVGMRLEGGQLIPNPNAQFQITETLRQDLRRSIASALEEGLSTQELAAGIRDQLGFPESARGRNWRAQTIARTETARAFSDTAATTYADNGVELLEILDGPGCTPDGHADGAPGASGETGVQLGLQANGQIWTPAQYAQYPVGHPNCVRAAVPFDPEDP